jgi:LysR family glycine cleavage system transcriptional activator
LPPLIELRVFEAAARHLSFKQAAAELGVTPTAVSHQIKLLELHCGQPLFRRRPRPLTLTWAGERLFPILRDGFENFADALASVQAGTASGRLRITATNAFAARWLVPRLPHWRRAHPRLRLDIIGTDSLLNLKTGEIDIAIRYCRTPPSDGHVVELARDTFHVVASPKLIGRRRKNMSPMEIARFPLIEAEWPPTDTEAPTWQRWVVAAKASHATAQRLSTLATMSFREELHAIEAVTAGQGLAICSDVLVGPDLASGALVRVSEVSLPGYGFYIVSRPGHPKQPSISAFTAWARALA